MIDNGHRSGKVSRTFNKGPKVRERERERVRAHTRDGSGVRTEEINCVFILF